MRNYKDAKTMAKSLRASLAARNVLLSHGECLEIVLQLPHLPIRGDDVAP